MTKIKVDHQPYNSYENWEKVTNGTLIMWKDEDQDILVKHDMGLVSCGDLVLAFRIDSETGEFSTITNAAIKSQFRVVPKGTKVTIEQE